MPASTSKQPTSSSRRLLAVQRARGAVLLLAALVLLGAYAATLQTQINGSSDEYMIDVVKDQVALNVWGTIHLTGYPLFAILGNLFTLPLRALGLEPAAAASLYALVWGAVMLVSFGVLAWRLTGRAALAALGTLLLGLARSIWIHGVIAEVYSMSLAITALLLLVALWPAPWQGTWSTRRRVVWLALLGGIGVAHHRAVLFVAPGLIFAAWPHLWQERAQWRRTIPAAAGLALAGFVPYLYLPLRAWQGGAWVYGEPGTLRGFWTQFSGREANRLMTLPADAASWIENTRHVGALLAREITLPGLLAGVVSLVLAMIVSPHRRAARAVALSVAGPTLFAIGYRTAVLPQAVLMPTVLALAFGVVLLVDWLARARPQIAAAALIGMAIWSGALIGLHGGWIHGLVTDPTGLHTIALVERVPRSGKPVLMMPWGPRYYAASYSRLVTGENADVLMVDHKGDYPKLLSEGYQLYTEPETFYTYSLPWDTPFGPASDWWQDHLGQVTLTSAAPGIVQLQNTPWLAPPDSAPGTPIAYGILRQTAWLTCDSTSIYLHVIWEADSRPSGDPSIFVHLTGDEPAPDPPNADSRHPVYGLYPFARLSPGELVRDDFTLPRLPDKTQVRFGLYDQDANDSFNNYGEMALPVAGCQPEASQ